MSQSDYQYSAVNRKCPLEQTPGPSLEIAGNLYYAGPYTDEKGQKWLVDIQGDTLKEIRLNNDGRPVDEHGCIMEKINGRWQRVAA